MLPLRSSRGLLSRSVARSNILPYLRSGQGVQRTYATAASKAEKPEDLLCQDQKSAQQDRHRIDRQSNEYSKSGTDDAVAAQGTASFDPAVTNDPEAAKDLMGEQNKVNNPLDVSPANPKVSEFSTEIEGGVVGETVEVKKGMTRSRKSPGSKSTITEQKVVYAGSTKKTSKAEEERSPMIKPGSR